MLCRFVAYSAEGGVRYCTIKVYLSAVRFLHIAEGEKDPFELGLARLQYTLPLGDQKGRGGKRGWRSGREVLETLRKMKAAWEREPPPGAQMLWAACCPRFFCFLWSGEMTVQADGSYDPGCHSGYCC